MRNFVEDWNRSEYPFNPHVTIGGHPSVMGVPPTHIAWGEDRLVFHLKR